MAECLFCNMAAGEMQVAKVHDDDLVFAIRDIHPRAPVHFMVIPKEHVPTSADVRDQHGPLLARMLQVAHQVARAEGIAESGYRLAINYGDAAGMTIYHLHMHVLGGHHLGQEG